ncbi:hypothetical protein [Vibrio phage vB_VmeM-Yong XC32]|nr:hypothetical protein [Vibrio phage vB_VmeM-Yong XC31]QAX96603.1 hypothetical protein [Vibrio phage vB_VmeM-Yong XC32]QAX96921.1 hypothetical protein [Vibrio phage vB_VmeM-Yong MS31]QAX97226.1 hypothetical protein [Vibrio phage vB_VmeM-Yong MS32]
MYDNKIIRLARYAGEDLEFMPWFFVDDDSGVTQKEIPEFKNTLSFDANDICEKEGKLYYTEEALAPADWDDTKWKEIAVVLAYLNNHKTYLEYELDSFVLHEDVIYKNNKVVSGEFNSADWDEVDVNTLIADIYTYTAAGASLEITTLASMPSAKLGLFAPEIVLPTPGTGTASFFMYYPSWSTQTFGLGDTDAVLRKPSNMPDYVTHTMLSFAKAHGFTFDKSSPDIAEANTGLQFPVGIDAAILKEDIAKAQAAGQKVYISVGGATYGRDAGRLDPWTNMITEAKDLMSGTAFDALTHVETDAYIQFMEYFELDGIDLDFEDNPAYHNNDFVEYLENYHALCYLMRYIADAAATTLTKTVETASACWSTGFDQTARSKADTNTPGADHELIGYFGDHAGRDRMAFGGFTDSAGDARNAAQYIDNYILMSYDAMFGNHKDGNPETDSDSLYDPVVCYNEARAIIPASKVVAIGLIAGDHGFGDHYLMLNDADCSDTAPHQTLLEKDQYQRFVMAPYSVERLCRTVRENEVNDKDGCLMWAAFKLLGDGATYEFDGVKAGTVTEICEKASLEFGVGTETGYVMDYV